MSNESIRIQLTRLIRVTHACSWVNVNRYKVFQVWYTITMVGVAVSWEAVPFRQRYGSKWDELEYDVLVQFTHVDSKCRHP